MAVILLIINFLFGSNQFNEQLKKHLDDLFRDYELYEYEIAETAVNYSRMEIDLTRETRVNKNYCLVPVILYDRNKRSSQSFISLKVKLYKKVLTANQKIHRGEILSSAYFNESMKEVTSIKGTPLNQLYETSQLKSRVDIRENSVLVKEMTESLPDININERLILHTGQNGVDITTDVTARENGNIGDVIRVVTDQKKIFKAKVFDKYNATLIE